MEFEKPFTEPTGRRIRVRLGGGLVADSTRARLLVQYGRGELPTYYLPREDVAAGALSNPRAGSAGQQIWDVALGSKRAEAGAWEHPNPTGELAELAGHVTFSWRQLEWYEEDERAQVHARDPYKRVDTLRSSRRVQLPGGPEGGRQHPAAAALSKRTCPFVTTCRPEGAGRTCWRPATPSLVAPTRDSPATGPSGSARTWSAT